MSCILRLSGKEASLCTAGCATDQTRMPWPADGDHRSSTSAMVILNISYGVTAQHHIVTSTSPWQPQGFAAALPCQLCMWARQQIERGVWPCWLLHACEWSNSWSIHVTCSSSKYDRSGLLRHSQIAAAQHLACESTVGCETPGMIVRLPSIAAALWNACTRLAHAHSGCWYTSPTASKLPSQHHA